MMPPLDEQKAIAELLSTFDDDINALEAKRDKMKELRDAAISDLLTGRIRLKI